METGNFTSPLQAVQMVSIFTYLNTLSDVLLVENLLNKTNQYQPIPVVNALYKYLFNDMKKIKNENIEFRKRHLAGKLIEDTDFYGAKENETLDDEFIDALFRHLITTLVFEKYTNIQGFLIEIVRHTRDLRINSLQEKILTRLCEEEFHSENGLKSQLEGLTVFKIYQDFIQPLFPIAGKDVDLLAIDYIYAQAGAAFRLAIKRQSLIVPKKFEAGRNDDFHSYVTLGHAIEQLAIGEEIDEGALQVFALPALFYYVTKRTEILQTEPTVAIVNNPKHVSKALRILFFHLKETFDRVNKARNDDYRLQFYSARSKFKNRTSLAREMIRSLCPVVQMENLDQEVLRYKNNPKDFECRIEANTQGTIETKLDDLNRIYQQKVNEVAEKYLQYELGSLRDAFGEEFMDAKEVEISKGLIVNTYDGTNVIESQLIKESADLFRFQFVGNGRTIYYAIVREDDNLTVFQEDEAVSDGCHDTSSRNNSQSTTTDVLQSSVMHCNPKDFREKLNLPPWEKFHDINFPELKKQKTEKFETFLTRISEERAIRFNKSLSDYGYEQTTKEWWTNFGLSLIPLYNCIHGIRTNIQEAEIACPLDVLFAIPFFGEVGYLATKLTTTFTRSIIYSAGTTFGSLGLRTSMREILAKLGNVALTQAEHFTAFFNQQTFRNLGLSFLRYVDPGFELIYTIGKGGLKTISNLITKFRAYSPSLEGVLTDLSTIGSKMEKSIKKIDTNSNLNVFVNSLTKGFLPKGYGFKFIQLPNGRVAQMRNVRNIEGEVPVLFVKKGDEITYRMVDVNTGIPNDQIVELDDQPLLTDTRYLTSEFYIQSFHDTRVCSRSRLMRSPLRPFCLRNILRTQRQSVEKRALEFVKEHPELSEDVVRTQLRKFIFPDEDGGMQLTFVKDWLERIKAGQPGLPYWSKKYEIHNSDLYHRLRYSDTMDKERIPKSEVINRFQDFYSQRYQYSSASVQAPAIQTSYEYSRAHESLTFEDFLAIRNYMGNGYRRIGQSTIEARQMREALLRLAIRQADDPLREYATTLYRGEIRPVEVATKLFFTGDGMVTLNRFTSTSLCQEVAIRFQMGSTNNVKILYEMKFSEPYLRANLQKVVVSNSEMETVLLPGSLFRIQSVSPAIVHERQILRVRLEYLHTARTKSEWLKDIMDHLENLRSDGASEYESDVIRDPYANSADFFRNLPEPKYKN